MRAGGCILARFAARGEDERGGFCFCAGPSSSFHGCATALVLRAAGAAEISRPACVVPVRGSVVLSSAKNSMFYLLCVREMPQKHVTFDKNPRQKRQTWRNTMLGCSATGRARPFRAREVVARQEHQLCFPPTTASTSKFISFVGANPNTNIAGGICNSLGQ